MSQSIDDILAGMETGERAIAKSSAESRKGGLLYPQVDWEKCECVVDKAYADRLEALCRKLAEQRNHFADGWNEFLPFDEAIAPFDAELAAIAKGGAK